MGSRLVTRVSYTKVLSACFELPTTISYVNIVRNTLAEGAIYTRHSTDDLPVADERLYRYHILDKFGYRCFCILAVLPRVAENIRFITQTFQPSMKQFHIPYPSYHTIATGFFLNFVEKHLRSARGTAEIIDRWRKCLENDGIFLAISVI